MEYDKIDQSKPTKKETAHYLNMAEELQKLQAIMTEHWVDMSIPTAWHGLDARNPLPPEKQKVTLRIDRDLYQWFRKLGPGYQARINQVLRIYVDGVMSGKVARGHDGIKPVMDLERVRKEIDGGPDNGA